jgi:hypothetical protein
MFAYSALVRHRVGEWLATIALAGKAKVVGRT